MCMFLFFIDLERHNGEGMMTIITVPHKKCSWSEFLQFSSELNTIALNGDGRFISFGGME